MFEREKEILANEKERLKSEEEEMYKSWVEILNRAKSLDKLERLRNSISSNKSMIFLVAKMFAFLISLVDIFWCIVFPARALELILISTIGGGALSMIFECEPLIRHLKIRKELKNYITPEILEDEQHKDQINEKVKNLSKELSILRKKINQINQELGEIMIKEKLFTDENINTLKDYFEEKLQEKNKEAIEKKSWCEKELEEYLNERIDYTDINLEVNPYEQNIHQNCGKNLTKTLFKN